MQSLKTRTPAAIYEITELVKEHNLKIPDPNTKDGKVTAEVQSFGPVALFEQNLVSQPSRPPLTPSSEIEKASTEVAGDGAAGTLKDRAAQLRMTAIDPMADTLRVLTNPKLVLAASVQINGISRMAMIF